MFEERDTKGTFSFERVIFLALLPAAPRKYRMMAGARLSVQSEPISRLEVAASIHEPTYLAVKL